MLMAVQSEPKIDFHPVLPQHADIHKRLENWGAWSNGGNSPSVSPMFKLYRAKGEGAEASWSTNCVDSLDAKRLARFMPMMGEKHRKALAWCYVKPVNPKRAAEEIGVSRNDLACLLHEGREKLRILGA